MAMEDDLNQIIQAARKTSRPRKARADRGTGMPGIGNTSFDTQIEEKNISVYSTGPLFKWAEDMLRISGSKSDRVCMAVRDAARRCASMGKDPWSEEFYVSPTIARGWSLRPKDLSEGLRKLEALHRIQIVNSTKGRYLRLILER